MKVLALKAVIRVLLFLRIEDEMQAIGSFTSNSEMATEVLSLIRAICVKCSCACCNKEHEWA